MTINRNISFLTKWIIDLLMITSLTVQTILPVTCAAETRAASAEEYGIFLEDKYGINVETSLTKGQFIEYIAYILDLQVPDEDVAFTDLASDDALYASAAALYVSGILSGPGVGADEPLDGSQSVHILSEQSVGLETNSVMRRI